MADIIIDGLPSNRFSHNVTGAAHGEVWDRDNANYFQDAAGKQIMTKGISLDTSGTLVITMADNVDVTVYLAAGIIHPIHAKRIKTGGTAGGVVTIWW